MSYTIYWRTTAQTAPTLRCCRVTLLVQSNSRPFAASTQSRPCEEKILAPAAAASPLGAIKLSHRVAACALLAEAALLPIEQHQGRGLVAGAHLAAPEVGLHLTQIAVAAVNLQLKK
jgi:hypothetical protein